MKKLYLSILARFALLYVALLGVLAGIVGVVPPPSSTTITQFPVTRILENDIVKIRTYYIEGGRSGQSITLADGTTFLPARRFVQQSIDEDLLNPSERVVWSFQNRSISIGDTTSQQAQIAGCILLDRTGYIPIERAAELVGEENIEVTAPNLLDSDLAGKIREFELSQGF